MPRGEIDDAEAAHTETGGPFGEDSFVVGAAVNNRLAHAMNVVRIGHIVFRIANQTRYSTHVRDPL
jgi:hypothetical protein